MNEAALGPEASATPGDIPGMTAAAPEITVGTAPEVTSGAAPEDSGKNAALRDRAERLGGRDEARAEPVATGTALIRLPLEKPRRRFPPFHTSHGLVAAAVAVLMGSGFVAGTEFVAGRSATAAAAVVVPPADTQMDVLYRVQGEVRSLKASLEGLRSAAEASRQDESLRGLKKSVDVLKQDLEGVKAASTGAVGQLSAKIEKLDRDPTPKLAEISARLDKLDHDPAMKLADIASRIERIERQVSSSEQVGSIATPVPLPVARTPAVPSPAPPVVSATSMIAAPLSKSDTARIEVAKAESAKADTAKADAAKVDAATRPDLPLKPAVVDGWMLRDVYGGVALVEGRAGGLREVAPGEYIPGVGEIRSIERRGRNWVVVTSRGIIQADNRW